MGPLSLFFGLCKLFLGSRLWAAYNDGKEKFSELFSSDLMVS